MELDQLKQMWQEQEAPSTRVLSEIIGKRSNSPIAKMKRNILLELLVVVISFGTIIIYYLLDFDGRFRIISGVYAAIAALFFIYFHFKYKLLHEMECMACQVKSNLTKQVATLEKFTRLYLIAGTAIIPLILGFFYYFEITNFPKSDNFFALPSENVSVAWSLARLLFLMVVCTVPMFFLNRWYIRKLYGRQIERLKQMLEQMEQH